MAVTINKVAYDFPNISVGIDIAEMQGTRLVVLASLPVADGMEELNYAPTIEFSEMLAAGRKPSDFTEGSLTCEGSLSLQLYWWRYLINQANALGRGLANIRLNMAVNFFKPGIPIETDTIWQAKLSNMEAAFQRGADTLMVPIGFKMLNIYYNGFDLFGDPL